MSAIISQDRIKNLTGRDIKLPSIPAVGMELFRAMQRPIDDIVIADITRMIEKDPPLAARLLRLANSSLYSTTHEVTRVQQAITSIGLRETLDAVNYFLFRKLMPKFPPVEGFEAEDFWRHSWLVAANARTLGNPAYLVRDIPSELYLAGLLHDLGRLVMATYLTEEFKTCLREARDTGAPLQQIETERIGIDHAALAGALLDTWELPEKIRVAVAFHHNPEDAPEPHRVFAGLVQYADALTYASGGGLLGQPARPGLADCWLGRQPGAPLADPASWEKLVREANAASDRLACAEQPANTAETQDLSPEPMETIRPRATPRPAGKTASKRGFFSRWFGAA